MTTRKLQTLQGAKVVPIESENEELDFASVRIGTAKAKFSQADAGTLILDKKLRAQAGTDDADFTTKLQLDAVANAAGSSISTVASNLTAETSRATAAESGLQTQVTANTNAIAAETTARASAVSTEASTRASADTAETTRATTAEGLLGGRLTTAESDLAAIIANNPRQGVFPVTAPGGQTSFVLSTLPIPFIFDALHTVLDVELWVNGARWTQCVVGDFSTGGFRKVGTGTIQTSTAIPQNAEVVIWKQGTNSAGGGGAGSDLTAIVTDPRPSVAGGQSLGTLAKPWGSLYLKDTATAQVYMLKITNGIVDFAEVP